MEKRKSYIPFGITQEASIDYLLGILADARVTTLERIKDISTDELHWQYAKGWNTIGALLDHIVSLENYLSIEFLEKRSLTETEEELFLPALAMGNYLPSLITHQPIEFYLTKMETSRKSLIQKIKYLHKADFQKLFYMPKPYNPETDYNLAWVFYHLAEDEIHHRGQISLIRKLFQHPKK